MANNVTVHRLGGTPEIVNGMSLNGIVETYGDADSSVKVNGQSVGADYTLKDYDFVTLGTKVKGGR